MLAGGFTEDRDKWEEELTKHCAKIHDDPEGQQKEHRKIASAVAKGKGTLSR